METQMKLQGLIISLRELNIAREEDAERFVMEDGLTELLDGLYRYNVQIVNLDMFSADSKEKLLAVLKLHNLAPECCLLLAATDRVLSMIEGVGMAVCGYLNPRIFSFWSACISANMGCRGRRWRQGGVFCAK